jgi:hypothetical protein
MELEMDLDRRKFFQVMGVGAAAGASLVNDVVKFGEVAEAAVAIDPLPVATVASAKIVTDDIHFFFKGGIPPWVLEAYEKAKKE